MEMWGVYPARYFTFIFKSHLPYVVFVQEVDKLTSPPLTIRSDYAGRKTGSPNVQCACGGSSRGFPGVRAASELSVAGECLLSWGSGREVGGRRDSPAAEL